MTLYKLDEGVKTKRALTETYHKITETETVSSLNNYTKREEEKGYDIYVYSE